MSFLQQASVPSCLHPGMQLAVHFSVFMYVHPSWFDIPVQPTCPDIPLQDSPDPSAEQQLEISG